MSELNELSNFIMNICRYFYYSGLPYLWPKDIISTKLNDFIQKINTILTLIFVFSEWMTFVTQDKLSEKQASDRIVFCFSHVVFFGYYFNVVYHQKEIAQLLYKLCVTLKQQYNDDAIQKRTIKKNRFYFASYYFTVAFALVSYGFDGLKQVVGSEGTFTTVVTAWPEVTDSSLKAEILRVVIYLVWWIFMTRITAVYALVTCISIIVGQQYKNLQSYFYSLNDIFIDDDAIKPREQERREKMYEEAVRIGFKLHDETLRCTVECQSTCDIIFSGQILFNVAVLCLLMLQMVSSERTLMNTLAIFSTALAVLISTGLIMWNAGDITVEAAVLPTAIFHSGWHNCRGKSGPRIKRMLVVAMRQSQRPVIIRSFGLLEVSYQSYLSIVKSSYSVFSLLY